MDARRHKTTFWHTKATWEGCTPEGQGVSYRNDLENAGPRLVVAGRETFAVKRTFWALLLLAVLVMGHLGVGLVVAARLSAPSHHS